MANRLARPLDTPTEEEMDLFKVMSALTDPVRQQIVQYIAGSPGTACSSSRFGVSKSSLTRHWRVLRESGVIAQKVDGTRHRNWLRREELDRRFPGLLALILDEIPTHHDDHETAPTTPLEAS